MSGKLRRNANARRALIRSAQGGVFRAVQIGPAGGNQRAGAIRQDQNQMQRAPAMRPAEHLQGLALEGMVLTDDDDARGIPIEVVVGSVPCVPSIRFHMTS